MATSTQKAQQKKAQKAKQRAEKIKREQHNSSTSLKVSKEVQIVQAYHLLEQGHFLQAKSQFTTLLKKSPRNENILQGLGLVTTFEGQILKAITYFEKAVAVDPEFASAYYNMALAYKELGNVTAMITPLRNAITFGAPESEECMQGQILLQEIETTISQSYQLTLNQFLENQTRFQQAVTLAEKQKFTAAKKIFQEVLDVDPTHVQALGNIGIVCMYLGEKQEALNHFATALQLKPDYLFAIHNRELAEQMTEGTPYTVEMVVKDYFS